MTQPRAIARNEARGPPRGLGGAGAHSSQTRMPVTGPPATRPSVCRDSRAYHRPPVSYSVIVVTWECADHLARLVASMNRKLVDEPQLVVVDNASTDRPTEAARRWRGPTRVIGLERNVGFGQASNLGVLAAEHEAVILLNPDTELLDDSLGRLARRALELDALVGPRLLNGDLSIQPSASGLPVGVWPWVGALVPQAIMPTAVQRRVEPWRLRETTEVGWLTGACVAGPRAVLRRLGPFDPVIHLYSEDLDLGLRARQAGVRSLLCPGDSRLVHFGDGSASRRFSDAGRRLSVENREAVIRRAYGSRREHRARRAEVLKLAVRACAKTLLGRDATREREWLAAFAHSSRFAARASLVLRRLEALARRREA